MKLRLVYSLCLLAIIDKGKSIIFLPSQRTAGSSVRVGTPYYGGSQQPLQHFEDGRPVAGIAQTQSKCDLSANCSALLDAIDVMQTHFFEVSHGTWPDAIDWTAEVMGTQVSATLSVISALLHESKLSMGAGEACDRENLINRYFTQVASFYFGENAFSLRTQAYDDMLWVVLGWLESVKFIKSHSSMHYSETWSGEHSSNWYARQFIPQFVHRARIFYELASRGWDDTLCGGGMIWNPYLTPYKNAITNQLFISASISMYLNFPGDSNSSPFSSHKMLVGEIPPAKAHDQRYLDNAIEGYRWLKSSGMRNADGLYADGFHIHGWRKGEDGSNGTRKCDIREEMVYTYNQGVLLSGLRGLWEATGAVEYLEDGHELIRDVIVATGWETRDGPERWRWAGLGRNGILEEACDWIGSCNQDGQTFKGIFFHHFSVFCDPFPNEEDNGDRPWLGDENLRALHRQSCLGYADWVVRNAEAALKTKNKNGKIGEWWGRSAANFDGARDDEDIENMNGPSGIGNDYRNQGVPHDDLWRLRKDDSSIEEHMRRSQQVVWDAPVRSGKLVVDEDINDRGRGRTVETQSGGLAVLRAAWKLGKQRESVGS